jgi:hypothetical protein
MSEDSIEKILEKWHKYKGELAELEKKVQRYKDKVEKYMNSEQTNNLSSTNFLVSRVSCSKTTVSKKDVPDEVWNKYCKRSKYWMYTLKQKK